MKTAQWEIERQVRLSSQEMGCDNVLIIPILSSSLMAIVEATA